MSFEVKNGSFAYKNHKVLNDVNFSIKEGDLLAILGPNGAGKTTLLRCMMGFLNWNKGGSYLDGKDIKAYQASELWKKISYVPQAKSRTSSMTVMEQILLGRASHLSYFEQPKAEDYEAVEKAMKVLDISHLSQRPMNELSGGEVQMALIARALVSNPKVLIFDEPESNLDFKNQLIVLDTLGRLALEKLTVIFNTHYPTHALQRANKALLLSKDGQIVFGSTENIINANSIERAFEVEAVIGDIETENKIYSNVLPIKVVKLKKTTNLIDEIDTTGEDMETRLAIISIIIEDSQSVALVNSTLHEAAKYIIGRMGMPYEKRKVSIITVVMDAPQTVISSLSGKLGQIPEVSIKTTYSKV